MKDIKIQTTFYLEFLLGDIIGLIISTGFYIGVFALVAGDPEVIFPLVFMAGFTLIGFVFRTATLFIWLMFFSFRFDDDYIIAKQGIISRQERHLPYVVMQDVVIKQSILDRLFGLATIVVENASMGGVMGMNTQQNRYGRKQNTTIMTTMGMHGNMFILSGIKLSDATMLRDWLLDKSIKVVNKQAGQSL